MSNPFATAAKPSNPFAAASNPFAAQQSNPFTAATAKPKKEDEEDVVDESYNPEEECEAEFEPLVSLPEVHVKPVEQVEDNLFEARTKLFRYDKTASAWKERGTGTVYILKNPDSKLTRVLFRQEQTLKIRANHFISPNLDLQPHGNSDRAFIWTAIDYADGEASEDILAIRFQSAEIAENFKEVFIKAQDSNAAVMKPAEEKEEEEEEEKVEEKEEEKLDLEKLKVEKDE
ncbi:hypothetical protein P9112_005162 [Eukaryota sp. TZLM1-RC]